MGMWGLCFLRLPRQGRQEGDKQVPSAPPLLSSHKTFTLTRMESAQGSGGICTTSL